MVLAIQDYLKGLGDYFMNSFYVPESAMVIVAHPDDIEFSCAGTIARWVQAGARISYVLCTSGDVGIAEEGMTREQAIKIREEEQRLAAEMVGVKYVVFLREPDGMPASHHRAAQKAGTRNSALQTGGRYLWGSDDRLGWGRLHQPP